MTDKRAAIDTFMAQLNAENCNKVNADNGLAEFFGKDKLFSVVCNRCASMDIEVIGEKGINYGGQTGYQEGTTAIKCNGCGSALTIWE
jgi:Zn finger protein HypA/HybF involved in hydrogenase expression